MPPIKTLKVNGTFFKSGGMQSQSSIGSSEDSTNVNKFPSPIQNPNENVDLGNVNKVLFSGRTSKKPSIPLAKDQDSSNANKKNDENASVFEATEFEKLTNISVRRPEIISLMPFQPLYSDSFPEKTESGKLFDIFVQSMKRLDDNATELAANSLYSMVESNNKIYYREISEIRRSLQSFYKAYRALERSNNYLNITGKKYDFDMLSYISRNLNDDLIDKEAISKYAQAFSSKTNIKKVLEFLNEDITSASQYSSTKSWIVLLAECYSLVYSHSSNLHIKNAENIVASPTFQLVTSAPHQNFARKVDLSYFSNASLTTDSLNNLGNYSVENSEEQKKLQTLLEQVAAATNTSVDELAGDVIATTANGVRVETAHNQVKDMLNLLEEKISDLGEARPKKVSLIFHLLAKELRHSKLYDENKLGNFANGLRVIANEPFSKKVARSIFGMIDTPIYDVFTTNIEERDRDSLLGLSYFPKEVEPGSTGKVNNNEKVVTFEKVKKGNFKQGFEVGGEYFFDPELLIQFSGVGRAETIKSGANNSARNNSQLSGPITSANMSVKIRSRIESLHSRIKRCDEDFFKFMTEMGGLPQKDDSFFDKDKPSIISNDPVKFFDNVWSEIQSELKVSAGPPKNFLNAALGAYAMLSACGSNEKRTKEIMIRMFLMVMAEVNSLGINDYSNLNNHLTRGFNSSFFNNTGAEVDQVQEIFDVIKGFLSIHEFSPDDSDAAQSTGGEGEFGKYEEAAAKFYSDKGYDTGYEEGGGADHANESKDLYPADILASIQQDKNVWISQYVTTGELGLAIRRNPLFIKIVKILRDAKAAFNSYAVGGADGRTRFSEVDTSVLLFMLFYVICRMFYRGSGIQLFYAQRNGFLGKTYPDGKSIVVGGYASPDDEIDDNQYDEEDETMVSQFKSLGVVSSDESSGLFELTIAYKFNSKNEKELKNDIKKNISKEMELLTAGLMTISNTLSTLEKGISEVKNLFSQLNAKDYLRIINYLGDPNKLTFLLKEPQLTLMMSNVEDVYQSFQDFSEEATVVEGNKNILFNRYYDRLSHSDKMIRMLDSLFSSSEFRLSKGYNKKIISVGMGQDLLKSLISNETTGKQNDIFKLSIYKIDLLNNDIIYKPKSYIFEASRYPVRVYKDIEKDNDSLTGIPTRNYTMFSQENAEVETKYWEDMSNIFDDTYSFLNNAEKEEILINHATSFLLENYIKIMTGLVLNESIFNLTSEEAETLLAEYENGTNAREVKSLLDQQTKQKASANLLSSAGKPKLDSKVIKEINKETMQAVVEVATKLNLTPVAATLKFLIQPKKFDRVFHIIFDPEFIVDQEKTKQTLNGRNKLQQMIDSGNLVEKRKVGLETEYVDVDKYVDDTTMESFFVVAETYSPKLKVTSDLLNKLPNSFLKATGTSPLAKFGGNSSKRPFKVGGYFDK